MKRYKTYGCESIIFCKRACLPSQNVLTFLVLEIITFLKDSLFRSFLKNISHVATKLIKRNKSNSTVNFKKNKKNCPFGGLKMKSEKLLLNKANVFQKRKSCVSLLNLQ